MPDYSAQGEELKVSKWDLVTYEHPRGGLGHGIILEVQADVVTVGAYPDTTHDIPKKKILAVYSASWAKP